MKKMNNLYTTIRKYIGPFELMLLLALFLLVAYVMEKKERREQQQQLVQQAQVDEVGSPLIGKETGMDVFLKNASNPHFKIMDDVYSPFMVDSLCRFRNADCAEGFLTMTKNAPFYKELCSTADEYYMLVKLQKYFPYGELVRITGVAENDEIIQFHFRREKDAEAMEDVIERMSASLKELQSQQSNGQKKSSK